MQLHLQMSLRLSHTLGGILTDSNTPILRQHPTKGSKHSSANCYFDTVQVLSVTRLCLRLYLILLLMASPSVCFCE
jgi:hypothetical protein